MNKETKISVERWLIKADHDLRTAQIVMKDNPPITDSAAFHAQQCVEKGLKAFIASHDLHLEKTHNLARLIEICTLKDENFQGLYPIAAELTDYAVVTRYPDDWYEISIDEAMEAVQQAQTVLDFVKSKLKLGL